MMLRNSKEYQVAFAKLGDRHGVIDDATFEQIEEFVCQMCSVRGKRNVNTARLSIFLKKFKVTNVNENFMKSAINFDGSSIPPCASELRKQVLRARYIANSGWLEKNGKYTFLWFEGEQVPLFVEDIIIQPEKTTDDITDDIVSMEENQSDSDSSENLSDDESE